MNEKRQHPRRPYAAEVIVHLGGKPYAAQSRDLSIGGMFVLTTLTPAFGTDVTIELVLPNVGATKIGAVVRWTTPDGFGVQFGVFGARETNAISSLIADV